MPASSTDNRIISQTKRRSAPRHAGEWAALLLFACYALLTLTPLLPGIPQMLGSLLATVLFAILSVALILALSKVPTRAWHEAAGLVTLLGVWWNLGQLHESNVEIRVYLGPLVSIIFLLACVCGGKLLSRIIRDRNMLLPVGIVAGLADLYTVFAGPTGQALQEAPKLVQKLSVAIPQASSAAGPEGHKALAQAATMGLGDIIFLAMFFAAAARFGFRLRRTYLGVLIPTVLAICAVLSFPWLPAVPLLPFIAGGFLVASYHEFRFSAEEKKNLKWAGLIVAALIAAGAVWMTMR